MALLLLILVTSAGSMLAVLTLGSTYWPASPLNVPASFVAGVCMAVWWARGHARMVRAALRGNERAVRRGLRLWGSVYGPMETLLLDIALAAEHRRTADVSGLVDTAKQRGLGPFAQAWATHISARMLGEPSAALDALRAGIKQARTLDRAELYCEGVVTLFQMHATPSGVRMPEAHLRLALEFMNQADADLREAPASGGWRTRYRYVAAFHVAARGLCYAAQDRPTEALEKLDLALRDLRSGPGLRGVRLAALLELERLIISGAQRAPDVRAVLREQVPTAKLPLVKRRLTDLLGATVSAGAPPAMTDARVVARAPRSSPGRRRPRVAPEGQGSLFVDPVIQPPKDDA